MRSVVKAFMLIIAVCVAAAPAATQERPKSLMELLFPRAKEKSQQKPVAKPVKPKPKAPKPRNRSAPKASAATQNFAPASLLAAPEPAAAPIEKSDTAKKILVVGDFLGAGLAAGLTTTFEQSRDVVIIDAANGSSGLVRDDFYNWPSEIGNLISQHQPSIVVVMIGANDRQQLVVSGKREEVRSPAWLADYRIRVRTLADAVTDRKIPLVWVGQVPFRSSSMTADMLALNDIFREAAENERAASAYVDVWEGFLDEAGKFIERGPDVNGQIVALRSGQVNVTKAGYRKIAFYAESTLNRYLGVSTAPEISAIGGSNLPLGGTGLLGADSSLERKQPIDLLDTTAITGNELLGATVKPTSTQPLTIAPQIPTGRIDDVTLRP